MSRKSGISICKLSLSVVVAGLLLTHVPLVLAQTRPSLSSIDAKLDQILQELALLTPPVGPIFPGDGLDGPPLRYQDQGDGTITDLNTGLVWEKKVPGAGCLHCVSDQYTFAEATSTAPGSFLHGVNTEGGTGLGGHSDWRLPNVRELLSLVDYSRANNAIAPVFSPTIGFGYWSSTSYVPDPSRAWAVFFSNGDGTFGDKLADLYARAVRGGR